MPRTSIVARGLSTLADGPRLIQECPEAVPSPNLKCTIEVVDPKSSLTARVGGPSGCRDPLVLSGGVQNFVIQYDITSPEESPLRFSGTNGACEVPVTEAGTCDFSDNPFLAFECHQTWGENTIRGCAACVGLDKAFCYRDLSELSVKLQISNVNDCEFPAHALLTYMLAIKATTPSTIDGEEFFRLYLVDPAVIQDINCPNGC